MEISSIISGKVSEDRLVIYHRWLRSLFRLLAIALAGLHTWAAASQYSMNPDGVSYLDIGDAYFRGDWSTAINPVWSPLYSWILGAVNFLLSPPMRWEFPVVHLANFGIYLGALASFEFFWRQLMLWVKTTRSGDKIGLPDWAWIALGYTLFIWSSLELIEIWSVTPDLLMSGLVYLAAGLILRIRMGRYRWWTFLLLGVVLGFGYLAKAVMLPVGLVFLATSLFSVSNLRRGIPYALVAFCAFLLISLPFIALISTAEGHLTISEASRLTYLRSVNGIPYPHWQGEEPGFGFPTHPTRRIFERPAIYEFGSPIGGTYPVSFNPSYWYEGAVPQLNLARQASALLRSGIFYFDLFFRQQGGILFGLLVLYLFGWKDGKFFNRHNKPIEFWKFWGLSMIAFAVFGIYAPVLVEGRYVGGFVLLLWSDLLAGIRLPESQATRKLSTVTSSAMVIFLLANLLVFNLQGYHYLISSGNTPQVSGQKASPPSWPGEVAVTLQRNGVQPGDQVAIIGYAFDAFWARLARVKIVAEMLDRQAGDFWYGDPALQSEVLQAFASSGAKAVVAENVPGDVSLPGWQQVGGSNYYIYFFDSG